VARTLDPISPGSGRVLKEAESKAESTEKQAKSQLKGQPLHEQRHSNQSQRGLVNLPPLPPAERQPEVSCK